jgi:phage-related protein
LRGWLALFKIKFYKDNHGNEPISQLLNELKLKSATSKRERVRFKKIIEYFEILSEYGVSIGAPYVKHITDDIWELRPIDDRIFFFHWKDGVLIMLHHFVKKTRKTPVREIEQAKRNQKQFLENFMKRGF